MSGASGGRAQSSPIGVVLILGLTLTAAVGIVVVGGDAIQGTQSRSEVGQAEQAMTQFDARAAQVALGDSVSQTVSLGGQGGSYTVAEDVGRVKLLHEDWYGTDCDGCEDYASFSNTTDDGNTTILYDRTLGALVYESGDATVAYQGGGVWRKPDDGTARPVSSPEFHYRDATLTFPLVRLDGSGGAGGQVKANVQRVETAEDVYPNQSETYPDGETKLVNPVDQGNMTVEVTSDYCEGWRTYFEERTEGNVSECDGDTVTADIVALGLQGEFPVTGGNELNVRGMNDGHSLHTFDVSLTTQKEEASDFNNVRWRLYGEDDQGRQLEFFITVGGLGNPDCNDFPEPVRVVVYYSPDGGEHYHSWVNDDSHGTGDYTIECQGDAAVLDVDFLDPDVEFEYTDYDGLSGNKNLQFDDDAENFNSTVSFGEHPGEDFEDGSITYPTDENQDNVTLLSNHYYALLGDVTMKTSEDNAAGLDDGSSGTIEYEGSGNVVTYLHVTENRIKIELA
jgi:hypothetical protein